MIREIEYADLQDCPKTSQYEITCACCDLIETFEVATMDDFRKELIEEGWSFDTENGLSCPECTEQDAKEVRDPATDSRPGPGRNLDDTVSPIRNRH